MKRWTLSLTALAVLGLFAFPLSAAEDPQPKNPDDKKAAEEKKAADDKKEAEPKITDVKKTADDAVSRGDSAWMLVSTGLVLFMVPGLALFYGGMVRRKNILGTMMHSMVCLGLIGIQWVLFGYSLAFGLSKDGLIGWNPDFLCLKGVLPSDTFPGTHIPIYLHCMYQGMFAIITPALISGAIAERIRFGPYCLFLLLWATLVYDPLAHWVWSVDKDGNACGILGGAMGALDFAGGTVVHIAAGFSSLAAILILRKRIGYPEHAMHPNSMVLTLTGAGILWFGWFGFNGGSALGATGQAVSALGASQVAAAAAALTWMVVEWIHKGKPTALGVASGLVAGLVAVTPASGYVDPIGGLIIGVAAGVVCYGAVALKPFFKYDDSLDAFGVHGVGGFLGAILTGFLASALIVNTGRPDPLDTQVGKLKLDVKKTADGKIDPQDNRNPPTSGRTDQIMAQVQAAVISAGYSFVLTFVMVLLIEKLWGFSLSPKEEMEGLDRAAHGEVGFDMSPATEMVPEAPGHEPRPAFVPPNGKKHFTVVIEGAEADVLRNAWSGMCGAATAPPPPEFRNIYPFVTTVKGNRFHFRGGDPNAMRDGMRKLFETTVGGKLIVSVVE
jgi:ammonium transporter